MSEDIQPHSNDVLSGRGNKIKKHEGNVHFRVLVSAVKNYYVALPSSEKIKVSEYVMEAVKSLNPPGRFLKEDEHANGVSWEELTYDEARKKTSQILREGQPQVKKSCPKFTEIEIHSKLNEVKVSRMIILRSCIFYDMTSPNITFVCIDVD